ncbi:MAG: DUF4124 domain-containing protein [Desulfobacteraceae bacterium]|nr:DUF4124 domain-containing protein [Desulfobacteraceae bacterium]
MKQLSLIIALLFIFFCFPVMSEQVYTWIDEHGVKHFTEDPPPEGATVVEKTEEIPYDEAKDQKRMEKDEQYFDELKQNNRENDKKIAEEAPLEKEGPDTVIIQEGEEDTRHQDRIEKRERTKHRRQRNK